MRPTAASDESAAIPAALFRSVLSGLIGAPSSGASPASATPPRAYAPVAKPAAPKTKKRRR